MRYHRGDIVEHALEVLDRYGLADLTMRRLGADLGVRPSAIYHHVPNKQTLLAAVADELLARDLRPVPEGPWEVRTRAACAGLRDALLARRDGAELVATVHAFGLGAQAAYRTIADALASGGLPEDLVETSARTLLHLVFGHTTEEQTRLQASSAGAIEADPRERSDFDACLALVIDGIEVRVRELVG